MTTPRFSVFRLAWSRLTPALLVRQAAIAIVIGLSIVLWLRLPDSSTGYLFLTALLAFVIACVATCGEAWIALALSGRRADLRTITRGATFVLAAIVVWYGWSFLTESAGDKTWLWSAYLNSKLPAFFRSTHSVRHIESVFSLSLNLLAGAGDGLIALFAFAFVSSPRPLRVVIRALRSATFWLTTVVIGTVASYVTGSLADWTPGHGIRLELISLILRFGFVFLIDLVVCCFVLALFSVYVQDETFTDAGTPDLSQPRTAGTP